MNGASELSDIYLSAAEAFDIGNGQNAITVNPEDIFSCLAPTTGATTSCMSQDIYFDGSVHGLVGNITGLDVLVGFQVAGEVQEQIILYLPVINQ